MKESKFQSGLIREIKEMMPGCIVLKNDPNYVQGIPDLSISYGLKTGWLECKESANASHRPNQDFYVNQINEQGGFARFVYPENKDEVLNELQRSLGF